MKKSFALLLTLLSTSSLLKAEITFDPETEKGQRQIIRKFLNNEATLESTCQTLLQARKLKLQCEDDQNFFIQQALTSDKIDKERFANLVGRSGRFRNQHNKRTSYLVKQYATDPKVRFNFAQQATTYTDYIQVLTEVAKSKSASIQLRAHAASERMREGCDLRTGKSDSATEKFVTELKEDFTQHEFKTHKEVEALAKTPFKTSLPDNINLDTLVPNTQTSQIRLLKEIQNNPEKLEQNLNLLSQVNKFKFTNMWDQDVKMAYMKIFEDALLSPDISSSLKNKIIKVFKQSTFERYGYDRSTFSAEFIEQAINSSEFSALWRAQLSLQQNHEFNDLAQLEAMIFSMVSECKTSDDLQILNEFMTKYCVGDEHKPLIAKLWKDETARSNIIGSFELDQNTHSNLSRTLLRLANDLDLEGTDESFGYILDLVKAKIIDVDWLLKKGNKTFSNQGRVSVFMDTFFATNPSLKAILEILGNSITHSQKDNFPSNFIEILISDLREKIRFTLNSTRLEDPGSYDFDELLMYLTLYGRPDDSGLISDYVSTVFSHLAGTDLKELEDWEKKDICRKLASYGIWAILNDAASNNPNLKLTVNKIARKLDPYLEGDNSRISIFFILYSDETAGRVHKSNYGDKVVNQLQVNYTENNVIENITSYSHRNVLKEFLKKFKNSEKSLAATIREMRGSNEVMEEPVDKQAIDQILQRPDIDDACRYYMGPAQNKSANECANDILGGHYPGWGKLSPENKAWVAVRIKVRNELRMIIGQENMISAYGFYQAQFSETPEATVNRILPGNYNDFEVLSSADKAWVAAILKTRCDLAGIMAQPGKLEAYRHYKNEGKMAAEDIAKFIFEGKYDFSKLTAADREWLVAEFNRKAGL